MSGRAIRKVRAGATLLALFVVAGARAAPEEIQVYLDDKEAPGGMSVDWHNNYVASGRSLASYAGEQPPAQVYRFTPELNVGLTDTLEYGLYVLTTRNREGGWHANGVKMRLKYIAPHDEKEGLFWGANIEAGRSDLAIESHPWNAELKGIVGTHIGPWTFGLNLNLDSSLSRQAGPVEADVDIKLNFALTGKTQIGVESFNQLGPLSHFDAWSRNSKTIYAVVDTEVAGLALNAGLGRGANGNSDRWTLKFILSTPL